MPYIFENKVAVDKEELIPIFWSSLGVLCSELDRYKDKSIGIKRLTRGCNGSKLRIDFDTLKPHIQEALGDPRKLNHPLEAFYETDPNAVRYYSKFKRDNGSYLTPDEQERYIINASVLKAVIKLEAARIQERIKMKGSLVGVIDSLVYDVDSFQNSLKVWKLQPHTLPTSKRFKVLLKEFKENEYYCVIKDPKGTGKTNARKVFDKEIMLLNALFKNQVHKPTPTEVARNYEAFLTGYAEVFNEDTGELFNPKGYPVLSQATIINYINKWEHKIATDQARSGDRQNYMGKYKPHHQMELPVFASSILSIDDRNPPFWYEKGKRAWFYIGCDVASRCFTTVVYSKSKEGLILDFYRQMVRDYTQWNLPLPHELECESSLNSSFKETILRPGAMFQEVKIEANNARGKYIERMFGSMRYETEKKEFGWIARPSAKSEANQAGPGKNQIIPFNELINARMLDIETWNNSPHPVEKHMSRFDYFLQNQHPNLQPTNWNSIIPHIGYKTPSSCKLGYVKLQGRKRAIAENGEILTGDALIHKMKAIEGKDVEIYWLDGNDGEVLKSLVYQGGRLICEIMEMPRYNRASIERTDADEMAIKLQSSYVATVEAFARTQRNRIENINIIDNTPVIVNSNFKFANVKRYEARETPVEVFANNIDDENNEDLPQHIPSSVPSWRSNFL
ncbi:MAG: hypothetical protein K2P85_09455 [Flavobacteriaceae bacterium]|nr:hypothetical protein [Flavobacteriaceae bacterium]